MCEIRLLKYIKTDTIWNKIKKYMFSLFKYKIQISFYIFLSFRLIFCKNRLKKSTANAWIIEISESSFIITSLTMQIENCNFISTLLLH